MEWKVFADKVSAEPIAECVHSEDAAALVALYGKGAVIKHGNNVVWEEGAEDFPASESYDNAAQICYVRADEAVSA